MKPFNVAVAAFRLSVDFCFPSPFRNANLLTFVSQVHREVREGSGQAGPGAVGGPVRPSRPGAEAVPVEGAHGTREPHRHHLDGGTLLRVPRWPSSFLKGRGA